MSCSSNNPLVRRPGRFRRMAARSFVRIVHDEADVTVWPRCWSSVTLLSARMMSSTCCNVSGVAISTGRPARLRYLSALPRTSAPNYGLPEVTGNVHHTWATFLCGYPLLPSFCPQKTHNATLLYRGTCTQGRRHFVTAATSVQSCAYRSLCVTIKLDSAAI